MLEAATQQQLDEEEDERDMNRTLDLLSTVVQTNEQLEQEDEDDMRRTLDYLDAAANAAPVVVEKRPMRISVTHDIEDDEGDMAGTIRFLARVARKGKQVGFADDLNVIEIPDDKYVRIARRGQWKAGPYEDELWNGFTFRDIELTPEELEDVLSRKQYRATRILKGLIWANKKVNIEGKAHAHRTEIKDDEDEEDGLSDEDAMPNAPSPTTTPQPAAHGKRTSRISTLFRRNSNKTNV